MFSKKDLSEQITIETETEISEPYKSLKTWSDGETLYGFCHAKGSLRPFQIDLFKEPTVWVRVAPDTSLQPQVDQPGAANPDLVGGPGCFLGPAFKALLAPPC